VGGGVVVVGGGVAVKGGGCEERERESERENGGRVTLVVTLVRGSQVDGGSRAACTSRRITSSPITTALPHKTEFVGQFLYKGNGRRGRGCMGRRPEIFQTEVDHITVTPHTLVNHTLFR
jgi:hypothetical protein